MHGKLKEYNMTPLFEKIMIIYIKCQKKGVKNNYIKIEVYCKIKLLRTAQIKWGEVLHNNAVLSAISCYSIAQIPTKERISAYCREFLLFSGWIIRKGDIILTKYNKKFTVYKK